MALTFDDGWSPTTTSRILRILQASRVNATFFPAGRAVEDFPTVWRAIAAAGFPIANHTYSHPMLRGRCFDGQLHEINREIAAVRQTLGIEPTPIFRPPGGVFDGVTTLAAAAAGEAAIVTWDVDTRDWSGASSATITRRALAGREGSIVLMHTFPANTAAALPAIIAGYRARGFSFVTVPALLGLEGPVPF